MNKLWANKFIELCDLYSLKRLQSSVWTSMNAKRCPLGDMSCRFSGHSKWQNIRHTKAAKDSQKGVIFSRIVLQIRRSVQKTGGTDVNVNREYAEVLRMARRANMPNTTIERAVKNALTRRSKPITLEIIGPNGCLIVLDAEVDNKGYFKNQVRTILKQEVGYGFVEGRADHAFVSKGVVRVRKCDKNGNEIAINRAEEVAIEADAEEVRLDDKDEVLLFITDLTDCHKTRKYIEENTNYDVMESGIELMATNKVTLEEKLFESVCNVIEQLEGLEEVNRVYVNIE